MGLSKISEEITSKKP